MRLARSGGRILKKGNRLLTGCCCPPPAVTNLHFTQRAAQRFEFTGAVVDDPLNRPRTISLFGSTDGSLGTFTCNTNTPADGDFDTNHPNGVVISDPAQSVLGIPAINGVVQPTVSVTLKNLAPTVTITSVTFTFGVISAVGTSADDVGVLDGTGIVATGASGLSVTFSGGTGSFTVFNGQTVVVASDGSWSYSPVGSAPASGNHFTATITDWYGVTATYTYTQP